MKPLEGLVCESLLSPIRKAVARGDLLVSVAEDALLELVQQDQQLAGIVARAHRMPTSSGALMLLAVVASEVSSWISMTEAPSMDHVAALFDYARLVTAAAEAARSAEKAAFAARGAT